MPARCNDWRSYTRPGTRCRPCSISIAFPVEGTPQTVARGEKRSSPSRKWSKATVDDLQKANHIEDGRKLQAGQNHHQFLRHRLLLPASPSAVTENPP